MKSKITKKKVIKNKIIQAARDIENILQEVWPDEKNVLYRSARLRYIRKLLPPTDGCVFCKAAKNKIEFKTLCIYKTKYSQIVLNKFPYNSGHLLVLPLKHKAELWDLSAAEKTDLFETVDFAFEVLRDVCQPKAINMGMNHGKDSGAGIPEHMHIHVIPRWAGDLNFFPLTADAKVVIEDLDQTYNAISKYVQKRKDRKTTGKTA